jgi:hypothetical protein
MLVDLRCNFSVLEAGKVPLLLKHMLKIQHAVALPLPNFSDCHPPALQTFDLLNNHIRPWQAVAVTLLRLTTIIRTHIHRMILLPHFHTVKQ